MIAVLCLAGILDSVYLTSVHYENVPLVCSASGVVNCSEVLHSSYATILGLPASAYGIVWFVVMALLAWRASLMVMLAWEAVGVASILWFVFVELFRLDKICLWCTVAHVLVLAIGATLLVAGSRTEVTA